MKKTRTNISIILLSAASLMVLLILAMRFGSVTLTYGEIVDTLFGGGSDLARNIIMNVRLPRVLVAVMVGANLAVSGTLLQAVMQNPLADSGLTGVNAGASLVAIFIMMLFPGYTYLVPLAAFGGGIIACAMVYTLAWKNGIKPMRIILAGVAVNAILGSGTSLLSVLYSDRIQGVIAWMNGSLVGKSWGDIRVLATYSFFGLAASMFCIRYANALQLGDKMAANVGVNTNVYRVLLSLVAVFLAGISVAITGPIGFIGLAVPHISRLIVGSDHKYLLPLSVVVGSMLVLLGDTFARTIASPIELPVGLIMAIIGAPFFLYLLRKGAR
ncbi:MAG: iron ABC transporter permease [Oscillospiraceae bacterium]|nr:iron ABC transporter permease [Oscillospiraceae bacterium]